MPYVLMLISIIVLVLLGIFWEKKSIEKFRIPLVILAGSILFFGFNIAMSNTKVSEKVTKKSEELRTNISEVKDDLQEVQNEIVVEVVKAKEREKQDVSRIKDAVKLDDKRAMRVKLAEMLDEE